MTEHTPFDPDSTNPDIRLPESPSEISLEELVSGTAAEVGEQVRKANGALEHATAEYKGMVLDDLRFDDLALIGTDQNGARYLIPFDELDMLTLKPKP